MAARRRTRRAPKHVSKIAQAQAIIRAAAGKGAQRSKVVQARVNAAGISTRTYRTARKLMDTLAIRRSSKRRRRGVGTWYVKTRRYGR